MYVGYYLPRIDESGLYSITIGISYQKERVRHATTVTNTRPSLPACLKGAFLVYVNGMPSLLWVQFNSQCSQCTHHWYHWPLRATHNPILVLLLSGIHRSSDAYIQLVIMILMDGRGDLPKLDSCRSIGELVLCLSNCSIYACQFRSIERSGRLNTYREGTAATPP